ncbi:BrnA antitoxin family protein [Oscillatoria salina]|uniref:BrnA antitoxin family protein n=1 Tax=Oscillatoria salina TaxID=331517 RepID=UPI001CC93E5B|nr:BrnA antitoxin family protein [Oscillatoria salina]MBZ8181116.1 BrnA antitoxin family protein [Oscillatoria salina IIICB1]
MSETNINNTSKTDWKKLETMTDDEIDYSDIPPLTDEFFARAKVRLPNTVKLDPEVLAWFKAKGEEYPALINQVLREYIQVQQNCS